MENWANPTVASSTEPAAFRGGTLIARPRLAKVLKPPEDHRPHLAAGIPEGEIAVVEALPHGRFDDLVRAVVPALAGEGARPSPAPRHFGGGEDVDARPSR
jgi:hypothetical protein